MTNPFAFERFEPLVGQGFALRAPDYAETLTLVSATQTPHAPPPGLPRGFVLIFDGENPATMLGQALYTLDNPAIGPTDIVLSCIGPRPDGGFQYQAIFN